MSNYLQHKKILLGITGGIAAYKILELIRRLTEQQAVVKVIMTEAAKAFITPLSVQALSGDKVYETLLNADNETAMSHIALARWADVLLIAPASANFIAKYAHGIADDLLTTVCLASTQPILLAPAMNQQMWQHSATQANVATLQQRQVTILGPASGSQACGEFGPGRMLEANELCSALHAHFTPQILTDKHILITAGPTQEMIDPVRFLTNHSSGKMGYALAAAALQLGATVTLISGPTSLIPPNHKQLNFKAVVSAAEMYSEVMDSINQPNKVDIFIGCAAVADYRPIEQQPQKMKKNSATLTIELERTTDILAAVATLPANKRPYTIGFAAETENLVANAQAKLQAKSLDLIIANEVSPGKGFNQDFNQVVLINKNSEVTELPLMAKDQLAYDILRLAT